jgi:hypothetical protein
MYHPEIIKNSTAIHFRGRDFAKWKPHSIISKNFFIDQIESIPPDRFLMLFTDDPLHETVVSIEDYIKSKQGLYCKFQGSSYSDFSLLSRSNRIIASPSTFSLCCALFGGKQIVMPKCYAEHEAGMGAPFWKRLISGEPTKYLMVELK